MRSAIIPLSVLVLIVAGPALVQADTVELVNGKKFLKVTIVEENLQKVVYKKPGLPNQSVPTENVKDVKYYTNAGDYKVAQEAYISEEWIPAAELYREFADTLDGKKDALRAHCMYRIGDCYQKAGMWKEASSALISFLNQYQEHRLYPEARKKYAQCLINQGDRAGALKQFNELKAQVSKKKMSDYWKFEVEYWLIYLNEKKNAKRALNDYKSLYNEVKDTYPTVANKARLRIGSVLIDQKKINDALAFFNDIIENRLEADREAVAGAYLGRAKCGLNKPKASENDQKEALYDLLRVIVHYTDVGAPQAEAMYYAGKCFQNLSVKDASQRWRKLFTKLKNEWPGSPWAQLAAQELGI